MKYTFVITALLLLFVANVLMVSRNTYAFAASEGFQNANAAANAANAANGANMGAPNSMNIPSAKANAADMASPNAPVTKEGFNSYFLENAGGSGKTYQSIGAYDGVVLPTGNNVSSWRYTAPNEKLLGDEFVPGPDSLFMFKNNQCKPECCGASFSCGGGCVCTTPQQRQYIASRGGNRTAPEDSA